MSLQPEASTAVDRLTDSAMKATICAVCLLLMVGEGLAGLALERPQRDCPTPDLQTVNEAKVWPEEYQIRSLAEPVHDAEKLSTTVGAGTS